MVQRDGKMPHILPELHNFSKALLFSNIRSLRQNFQKLRDWMDSLDKVSNAQKPAFLGLSEIWRPLNQHSHLLGYHPLIKKERDGSHPNAGGGVGIFIRNDIEYSEIPIKSTDRVIEMNAVQLPHLGYSILNCYRPPGNNDLEKAIDLLHNAITTMRKIHPKHNIIVGGDFNVDFLCTQQPNTNKLLDLFSEHQLAQTILTPTRITDSSATCIDNIFASRTDLTGYVVATGIADHLAVAVKLEEISPPKKSQIQRRKTGIKQAEKLADNLAEVDWEPLKTSKNPCAEFYRIFQPLFDKCCPLETVKMDKNFIPIKSWMTDELLSMRREKFRLWKIQHKDPSDLNRLNFKKARNQLNTAIRKAKVHHLEGEIKANFTNGRKIWQITNNFINRKGMNKDSITHITHDQQKITDPTEMASRFNDFFSGIGEKLASAYKDLPNDKLLPPQLESNLAFQPTNESEIKSIVDDMQNKLSTGHDDISNKLLKIIIVRLLKPLTIIINYSIENHTFPDEMKIAKVVPVFKKGAKDDVNNYRPISLLPTISKIFEKIIDKQIRRYMEDNWLWSDNQFGFRARHETGHAVIKALNAVAKAKEKRNECLAIFLDLKKAFDTVPHERLLQKISRYGINNSLLRSYLSNRKQYTAIDNKKSNSQTITCGVPQGSILGPTLFLLYINDVCNSLEPDECLLFADDTTFIFSAPTKAELIQKTNKKLEVMNHWYKCNKLTVHPGKTLFMAFQDSSANELNGKIKWDGNALTRAGTTEKEKYVRYVGIKIDEKLTFKEHANHVHRKITTNLNLISTNKNILPFAIRKLLYNAIIRPYFDYGAEIWGHNHIKSMTTLQKKCIRHVIKARNHISHTNQAFVNLETPKFFEIVTYNSCRLGFKLIHVNYPPGLRNDFLQKKIQSQRRQLDLPPQYPPLEKLRHLPLFMIPQIWNDVPSDFRQTTDQVIFKSALKQYMINCYRTLPPCSRKNCPSCLPSHPFTT